MKYFEPSFITFFQELEKNNNRDWFQSQKKRYELVYKKPAAAFSDMMVDQLQSLTGVAHRSKTYRINRDVRFSKDKTPYNCHLHISFTPEGRDEASPSWFFGLGLEKLSLGVGVFGFSKDKLETYRRRVDGAPGEDLEELAKALQKKGVRFGDPDLKRVPKPYDSEHPRADWLKHKGLSCWLDFDGGGRAFENDTPSKVSAEFKKLAPLYDWLMEF